MKPKKYLKNNYIVSELSHGVEGGIYFLDQGRPPKRRTFMKKHKGGLLLLSRLFDTTDDAMTTNLRVLGTIGLDLLDDTRAYEDD